MYKVYGKPNCPNCDKAKHYLDALGKEFEYVDLSEDAEKMKELQWFGIRSVPVVFKGDVLIGGWESLVKSLES